MSCFTNLIVKNIVYNNHVNKQINLTNKLKDLISYTPGNDIKILIKYHINYSFSHSISN